MDSLPNQLLEKLTSLGTQIQVQSHQVLIEPGSRVQELFLVKKGGLVLNHIHPVTARERAINFFIPSFHPLATVSHALVMNEPSKYSLKTFTNTVMVKIEKQALDRFIVASEMGGLFQKWGAKIMIEKNEIRAQLISLNSFEMLQYLQFHYPQILQQVPSKYVADFLGITPQWLSKLKHKL